MSIDSIRNFGPMMAHYVDAHHTTRLALIGGGMCALATVELALRTLRNLWQVISNDPAARREEFGETVSRNIGGMVLFGACATNAIPGLAVLGGTLLVANAVLSRPSHDALLVTKAIRFTKPLTEEVAKSAWSLVKTCLRTIFDIVKGIFDVISAILAPIGTALGRIFLAVIPKTPEAVAAVAVVGAIAIYKLVLKR